MSYIMDWHLPGIDKHDTLDINIFYRDYLAQNRPVAVSHMARTWPCMGKWTTSFFRNVYSCAQVPVFDLTQGVEDTVSMHKFLDYLSHKKLKQRATWYLNDWSIKMDCKALLADVGHVPWAQINWLELQPDANIWPTVSIGPENSFTPLHSDIYASHAWNTVIEGKKDSLSFLTKIH